MSEKYTKANFDISGNIEPRIESPLDNRVQALNDYDSLFASETWKSRYLYNGMIVPVIVTAADKDNTKTGLYMLINKDNPTDQKSWMPIKGGIGNSFGNNLDGGTPNSKYITADSYNSAEEYESALSRNEVQVLDGGDAAGLTELERTHN